NFSQKQPIGRCSIDRLCASPENVWPGLHQFPTSPTSRLYTSAGEAWMLTVLLIVKPPAAESITSARTAGDKAITIATIGTAFNICLDNIPCALILSLRDQILVPSGTIFPEFTGTTNEIPEIDTILAAFSYVSKFQTPAATVQSSAFRLRL